MALPQGGPGNPSWSWSVQLQQPGVPTTAPPAPPTPPAPPRDDYGGETVTLVPGRLRGYRSWRIVWPQSAVRSTPPGIGGFEPYLYPPNVTLAGVTAATGWRPGDQPEAECQRLQLVKAGKYKIGTGQQDRHPEGAPVPAKGCSCGFYGLHSPSDYQVYFTAPCVCPRCVRGYTPAVMGAVEGSGRVEIGPLGWRARQARIVALHIPAPRPAERTELVPQQVQPIWQSFANPQSVGFGYETRTVKELCERAEAAFHELWHALAHKYQVPVFRNWRDLVYAFPPTDLKALRAAKKDSSAG